MVLRWGETTQVQSCNACKDSLRVIFFIWTEILVNSWLSIISGRRGGKFLSHTCVWTEITVREMNDEELVGHPTVTISNCLGTLLAFSLSDYARGSKGRVFNVEKQLYGELESPILAMKYNFLGYIRRKYLCEWILLWWYRWHEIIISVNLVYTPYVRRGDFSMEILTT